MTLVHLNIGSNWRKFSMSFVSDSESQIIEHTQYLLSLLFYMTVVCGTSGDYNSNVKDHDLQVSITSIIMMKN